MEGNQKKADLEHTGIFLGLFILAEKYLVPFFSLLKTESVGKILILELNIQERYSLTLLYSVKACAHH